MSFLPYTVDQLRRGAQALSAADEAFLQGWPGDFLAWWEIDQSLRQPQRLVVEEPPWRTRARRLDARLSTH